MTPHLYNVRVAGRLGPAGTEAFADVAIELEPGATVLSAELCQSGLHELLDRIRALGLELVDVRQPASAPPDEAVGETGDLSRGVVTATDGSAP
jgi:hypothetical protein